MRILRAAHLGMCFGVRDAIALALEHADAGPLTILGDLVHNPTVLGALEAKGIAVAQDVAHVKTPTLMVTAHGTSGRTLARIRALGLTVVEATCPLVHVAHHAVAALAREGYHVVIVGQRDHVEVRGLTGDLDRDNFSVVLEDDDVLALEEHPRFGVAAQTTQALGKVRHLVDLIGRRFPQSEVRFVDTVCKPTKERQSAAVEMARQADVVIVVGGQSSNNTRELVKTCARYCARVHHVQSDADVCPEWFDAANGRGTDRRHLDARRRHRSRRGAHPPFARTSSDVEEGMTGQFSERTRWAIVMAFAIAMAWVESASVFYIRALVDRIEPYQANPLPINGALGHVELWREAATLVMLATLGMLAGRTWRRRAGYAAMAFGVWDIFYYVFLRFMSGWPRTLLDWDILFLLPLPWWGPVLAPVSIAVVMILWGTLATQSDDAATEARWTWALGWLGIVLALGIFMIDAWRALPNGRDAVLQVLPDDFNWPLFWVALLLMASPLLHQVAQNKSRVDRGNRRRPMSSALL